MFEIHNLIFKNILNIDHLKIDRSITCLTGPSGCGKSTLLRMLNKMEVPDSGIIKYAGEELINLDTINLRRQVTMLPQTAVIYEGNVKDNLLIGFKMQHRETPSDDALNEMLIKMQLKLDLSAEVKKLSGGEKQRLCLARVLLLDSEVYLLDEPGSALDPNNEAIIMSRLVEFIRERKKQLIMVTHSFDKVEEYTDHLIQMEGGRILSE